MTTKRYSNSSNDILKHDIVEFKLTSSSLIEEGVIVNDSVFGLCIKHTGKGIYKYIPIGEVYSIDLITHTGAVPMTPVIPAMPVPPVAKYDRVIRSSREKGDAIRVDVYDVLLAFDVKCPALQHLIKKALCAGLRGHKDFSQDLTDILDSAKRAIELHQ